MAEELETVEEIVYISPARDVVEIRAAVVELLAEAAADPALLEGVDVELSAVREGVTIKPTESGFGAETIALVVIFAPSINHVATSIWDKFLLPGLKRALGADAVGKEKSRKEGQRRKS